MGLLWQLFLLHFIFCCEAENVVSNLNPILGYVYIANDGF